jgi:RHS repeat-associated protein
VFAFDATGNLLTQTDRLGQQTSYAYDALYRRTSETNANGETTAFTYDLAGNRLTLTDPESNTTTWAFDNLNRVTSETNELSAARYFSYDSVGNLIQKIDRDGRYTQYEYDNLYRRTEERWLDPTDDTTVIHTLNWVYDAASQLTEAADSFADYDYTYDNLGRATSIAATLVGLTPTVTLAQQFDANSRRTQLAATIGTTADFQNDYTFDGLNRMTRITQQDVTGGNAVADKRVDLAYNAAGQFTAINRYANLTGTQLVATSAYSYDGTGRLMGLTHSKGGTTFAGYGWAYDAANRITSFTNSQYSAEDAAYNYDAASQLTGADRSGTANDEAYTFDDNGNRTNGGFVATTNNRLATDGTYNYSYDDEGNTILRTKISDGSYTEYAWDHRNRLTAVTDFDASDVQLQKVTYAYDAFNRLVSRTLQVGQGSATSGYFVYDGTQMMLVLEANGTVQQRTLWGPAVDQILADENAAGDLYWMLTDNQNTVRDVLEYDSGTNTSTVVNHIVYDSFGRKLSETDDMLDVLSLNYTGRYLDEATGLQWNLNRWYNPATQRWMSEDPIKDETNWYSYVGNCPSVASDPTGLLRQPTGVFLGKGYRKDSWGFNPWLVSIHGFIVIDGRGYGRFEKNGCSVGTSQIRDNDLDIYPNEDVESGKYYSNLTEIYLDDQRFDIDKFKQTIRDFIASQKKAPGRYVAGFRDCHHFAFEAVYRGLEKSYKGEGLSAEAYYWSRKGVLPPGSRRIPHEDVNPMRD